MNCKNCGKELKGNEKYCPTCGKPIPDDGKIQKSPESDDFVQERVCSKKKKRVKWSWIMTAVLLLAAVGISAGLIVKRQQTKQQTADLIAEGNRYLEALDYEKAADAYLRAIAVAPKEKEPYLRLTELYLGTGDVESAQDIIQQAQNHVADSDKEVFESMEKEYENLEEYAWAVEPLIEADNIYYLRDEDARNYSINEQCRQKYSDYAVIKCGDKFGLIKNDGTIAAKTEYDDIWVASTVILTSPSIVNPYMLMVRLEQYEEERHYLDESSGEVKDAVDVNGLDLGGNKGIFYFCGELYNIMESYDEASGGIVKETRKPLQNTIPVKSADSLYPGPESIDGWIWYEELQSMYAIYSGGELVTDFVYEECGSESSGLLAVKQNGKWGYVNESGEVVIPLEYDASWEQYVFHYGEAEDYCYAASEGFVPLVKDGVWEMRNTDGALVIAPGIFDEIRPVYNGKCWVKKDERWGVIELKKTKSENKKNYLALVQNRDGKYGYIDEKGNEAIKCSYDMAYDFSSNGVAAVGVNDSYSEYLRGYNKKYGFIDTNGEQLTPFEYDAVSYINEGVIAVAKKVGEYGNGEDILHWGFINGQLKEITEFEYQFEVSPASLSMNKNGLIVVSKSTGQADLNGDFVYNYGVIDSTGKEIIPVQQIRYGRTLMDSDLGNEGLIALAKKNTSGYACGFVNYENQTVISFEYENAANFSENGLAAVEKNGRWGYIDVNGDMIIPCKYRMAESFAENGLALVETENGTYEYIDEEGKTVLSGNWDEAESFGKNGLAMITEESSDGDTLKGLIDSEGEVIVPAEFKSIEMISLNSPIILCTSFERTGRGKYMLADRRGNLSEKTYDMIEGFGDNAWMLVGNIAEISDDGTVRYQYSYIDENENIVLTLPDDYTSVWPFKKF